MSSNLPPGCTSADGGIDHAFESACETLCDNLPDDVDFVVAIKEALPGLRVLYNCGFRDGEANERLNAEMSVNEPPSKDGGFQSWDHVYEHYRAKGYAEDQAEDEADRWQRTRAARSVEHPETDGKE